FGQGGAGGDFLGSIFSGAFGGARAEGGPVMAGRTYLVGERGPELWTPSMSGSIIPNSELAAGGGSQNVYNIDARGTDASVLRRFEQLLQGSLGRGAIEHRMMEAERRGIV